MTARRKQAFIKSSGKEKDDKVEISLSDDEQETQGEPSADSRPAPAENLDDKPEPDLSIESLSENLKKIEQEKMEISDRLLRTMAEFDNYKKRVTKEKENLIIYGTEKIAYELLSVVDNFERALEQEKSVKEIDPFFEGVEMILKQLLNILEQFHIKPFDSVGTLFDPAKHEAMAQQEHPEYEENTVIEEFQKGYSLSDKLLRPARVIVAGEPSEKNMEGSETVEGNGGNDEEEI